MSASELLAPRRVSPAAPSSGRRRALPAVFPFPPGLGTQPPAPGRAPLAPPPVTRPAPAGPLPPEPAPAPTLPLEWQRIRRYAGGSLLALCFALFGWQVWHGRPSAPVLVDVPAETSPPPGAAELRVHVSGAVAAPGVYRLTAGDRVEDAVRAAGGFAAGADAARVNLAQRVRDEQRLDVPAVGQPSPPPDADPGGAPAGAPAGAGPRGGATSSRAAPSPSGGITPASLAARDAAGAPAASGPPPAVNVNTATAADLEALPGIGEVTARRILAYREAHGRVRSLDELRQAGIPETLLRRAAGRMVFE
jgi:competence protein ComEA